MGCSVSKERSVACISAASEVSSRYQLGSNEAVCKLDANLQSFNTLIEARKSLALKTVATGVEIGSMSSGSLKGVAECLMEMNQEAFIDVLQCKKDTVGDNKLFEEYFENSRKTLDFCGLLQKCLKRAQESQLLVLAALNQFDKASEIDSDYSNTFTKLKCFRAAGDPFTEEYFLKFQSVRQEQMKMLHKFQELMYKLDKKLKRVATWRKICNVIFISAFAAMLTSLVVAATAAATPLAAALSAGCSIPIASVGKWVDAKWNNYKKSLEWQKATVTSMRLGTYVAIKDLENIRAIVERIEVDIGPMLNNAELASEKGALKYRIADTRKRLQGFISNVKSLGSQAEACGRDIRRARTEILQRILKNPNDI